MNTQQLLLNAAKAMGLEVAGTYTETMFRGPSGCLYWNPLTNAEQLNQMRAKLQIDTDWFDNLVFGGTNSHCRFFEYFKDHPTPQAAEAMAALRVAAAVGEKL